MEYYKNLRYIIKMTAIFIVVLIVATLFMQEKMGSANSKKEMELIQQLLENQAASEQANIVKEENQPENITDVHKIESAQENTEIQEQEESTIQEQEGSAMQEQEQSQEEQNSQEESEKAPEEVIEESGE